MSSKKLKVSRSSLDELQRDLNSLRNAEDRMERLVFLDELAPRVNEGSSFWDEEDREGRLIEYEPKAEKLGISSCAYHIWDGEMNLTLMDGCDVFLNLDLKNHIDRRTAIDVIRPIVEMLRDRVAVHGIEFED